MRMNILSSLYTLVLSLFKRGFHYHGCFSPGTYQTSLHYLLPTVFSFALFNNLSWYQNLFSSFPPFPFDLNMSPAENSLRPTLDIHCDKFMPFLLFKQTVGFEETNSTFLVDVKKRFPLVWGCHSVPRAELVSVIARQACRCNQAVKSPRFGWCRCLAVWHGHWTSLASVPTIFGCPFVCTDLSQSI